MINEAIFATFLATQRAQDVQQVMGYNHQTNKAYVITAENKQTLDSILGSFNLIYKKGLRELEEKDYAGAFKTFTNIFDDKESNNKTKLLALDGIAEGYLRDRNYEDAYLTYKGMIKLSKELKGNNSLTKIDAYSIYAKIMLGYIELKETDYLYKDEFIKNTEALQETFELLQPPDLLKDKVKEILRNTKKIE